MKAKFSTRLIAPLMLGALAAPAAAQSGTFSLPPNPTPTPSGNPNVQGPVDPDRPFSTRPRDTTRPSPTPTPTPRATASAAPEPVRTPAPSATRSPRPRATSTPSPARPSETPRPLPAAPHVATPAPTYDPFPSTDPVVTPTATPAPAMSSASPEPARPEEGGWPWGWIALGALAALAAAAGALFYWRRREEAWDEPGAIEPPLARRPDSLPAGGPAPVVPLMVEAQALRLSRSLMYATLGYELRLANRGRTPLANIRLGGDLVTAHGRVPVDQQLADPMVPLETIQQVPALAPGESTVLTGEIRLPVGQIRPIRQGSAVLYIPLLRLRIEADGLAPFARTFVVGKRPAAPGGRLQPFRLDETPQTYRAIAQRALD